MSLVSELPLIGRKPWNIDNLLNNFIKKTGNQSGTVHELRRARKSQIRNNYNEILKNLV